MVHQKCIVMLSPSKKYLLAVLIVDSHVHCGVLTMNGKIKRGLGKRQIAVLLLALFAQIFSPASALVIREDDVDLGLENEIPSHLWKDDQVKPKALAVAIHGLVMHGGLYDVLAKRLAAQGFIVLAPDLRGCGRWLKDEVKKEPVAERAAASGTVTKCLGKHASTLDYEQSYEDLVQMTKAFKTQYSNLPLYLIGESLGAGLALHLASVEPGLVDGLVLSSPAIKRHSFYGSIMSYSSSLLLRKPHVNVDLVPFIRRYVSEDPRVIEEALSDPLVRKKLTAIDLLKTSNYIKPTLRYAKDVSESTPVLILQGSKDRILKSNAVVLLLKHMKSRDQTVRWFNERGHLLLETAYAQPDTLRTVESWLGEHASDTRIIEAHHKYDGDAGENSVVVDAIN